MKQYQLSRRTWFVILMVIVSLVGLGSSSFSASQSNAIGQQAPNMAPHWVIEVWPHASCTGWSIDFEGSNSNGENWRAKVSGTIIAQGTTQGNETVSGSWPAWVNLAATNTFRAEIYEGGSWLNRSADFGPCPTPTPTPTATPSDPPHLTTAKEATAQQTCQEAQVSLHVTGAGSPVTERQPLDVMIVLDRSLSMDDGSNPPQPLTDAKDAAKILVDELNSSLDRVGVVSYGSTASLLQGLTSNFSNAKSAITGITADGYTNIGDAVNAAQAQLNSNGRVNAEHIMVVLSDGVANRSHSGTSCTTWPTSPTTCTNDAINQAATAKTAGTTLFTIGLNLDGVEADHPGSGVLAEQVLQTMASNPDYYYQSPNSSDLDGIFADIADAITSVAGTDVTIVDILPAGVHYVANSASIPPSSIDGQTLTWQLGLLSIGDTRSVTFRVSLDTAEPNQLVDVYPDSRVDYDNYLGSPASLPFPETRVTVQSCATATPTNTPTPTATPTHTWTPTNTPTYTPTPTATPASGSIGDVVWNDANGNGEQDEGPGLGLNDVKVDLYLDNGDGTCNIVDETFQGSQVTAGDGAYDFTNLNPGVYCVAPDANTIAGGYTFIPGPQSGPIPYKVVLGLDETNTSADFGYAGRGNITGLVFWDWNEDGVQGIGEDGIGDIEVCLYKDVNHTGAYDAGTDTLVSCQQTSVEPGSEGFYNFTNNHPGDYVVVQDPIPGLDSTTGRVRVVALVVIGASGSNNDNDFGNVTFGSIGDFIYLDSNGNGAQDPSENAGVPGMPVTLTNLSTFAISTTVSAANGAYIFLDLLPGSYRVETPFALGGIVRTSPSPLFVNLGIGQNYEKADFGYITPTAVELTSLTAERQQKGVKISWITAAEADLTGFRIWRAVSNAGPFKVVSPVVAASNKPTGSSYEWLDVVASSGTDFWYRLESLPDGEMFGPIPVRDDPGTGGSKTIYIPLIIR